ncbi:MAG: hypothetical protein ACRD10_12905, partial [Terriglobia bacterium]
MRVMARESYKIAAQQNRSLQLTIPNAVVLAGRCVLPPISAPDEFGIARFRYAYDALALFKAFEAREVESRMTSSE